MRLACPYTLCYAVWLTSNQGAGLVGNLAAIFLIGNGDGGGDGNRRCHEGGAALIVLGWRPHVSPLFIALAGLCGIGGLVLTGLRPMPRPDAQQEEMRVDAQQAIVLSLSSKPLPQHTVVQCKMHCTPYHGTHYVAGGAQRPAHIGASTIVAHARPLADLLLHGTEPSLPLRNVYRRTASGYKVVRITMYKLNSSSRVHALPQLCARP